MTPPGISPPLERFLGRLEGVRKSGEGYTARCPAHDDRRASLSVSEGDDGRVLIKCFAGCDARDVVAALGLAMKDLFPEDEREGLRQRERGGAPLTVADLAQSKRLPPEFLKELGLTERNRGVEIPYFFEDGSAGPRPRRRTSTRAKDGSFWSGEKDGAVIPYGLWRLGEARQAGYAVLVEGESDAWSLWYHGLPALGIPGASMTGTLQPTHFDGIARLYVVKEPDKGGSTFVRGVCERLRVLGYEGEARLVAMPAGAKDPNALHAKDPDGFPERMKALLDQAPPLDYQTDPEAPFTVELFKRQIEGLTGSALEAKALEMIERAAAMAPADLLRAETLLKEHATAAFARKWASAAKKTPADRDAGQAVHAAGLAAEILRGDRFAKDRGRMLYRYDGGVYHREAEEYVRRRLQETLRRRRALDRWSKRLQGDVVEFIVVQASRLEETWPRGSVNLSNGILDMETRSLKPHTPDLLTSIQFPVRYDPEARCPALRKFAEEVLPSDATDFLAEAVAWCLMPDNPADQCVMLRGAGGNGKSVLLDVLIRSLGRENVSAVELHELSEDKYALADLYLKTANVAGDLTTAHLKATGNFKKITGDDLLRAQRKFGHAFQFKPRAKLLFSANQTPISEDTSEGFFRRWVVVPFTRSFQGAGRVKRATLLQRLTTDQERSGLLNWALAQWEAVAERGLSISASMQEAHRLFRLESNPLGAYLAVHTVLDLSLSAEASIPCKEIIDGYNAFAQETGAPRYSATKIGLDLKKLFPEVRRVRASTWIDVHGSPAHRPRVYKGLRWKEAEEVEEDPQRSSDRSNESRETVDTVDTVGQHAQSVHSVHSFTTIAGAREGGVVKKSI